MSRLFMLCALTSCRINFDENDNCPGVDNPDQADSNDDGIGDACSTFCTGRCENPRTCRCIDFDDDPQIPSDWELLLEGTATGATTTRDVRSAPRSLNLAIPPGLAEGLRNFATFRSGLLATNLHVVMELDWKLSFYSEMQSGHTVQFASVFMNNSANAGIGYSWDGVASTGFWFIGRSAVDVGGALYPIARPPTSETQWTHVRFDVTFSNTGNGHLYVSFDGNEVVHEDNLTNAPATTGPQTMVASPIVWTLQGTTPRTDVFYDNIWFDVD